MFVIKSWQKKGLTKLVNTPNIAAFKSPSALTVCYFLSSKFTLTVAPEDLLMTLFKRSSQFTRHMNASYR